ncbi:hypothetical protein C6A85_96385, partial [Mycobacterium sp. ITM-2017-0098]
KVGADVLPWWPVRGVYLTLENGTAPAHNFLDIDGVAGLWTATSLPVGARLASAPAGQTISYYFLDDDPVRVAERLRPALDKRWSAGGVDPLFAAPFYPVIPHEWDSHVP